MEDEEQPDMGEAFNALEGLLPVIGGQEHHPRLRSRHESRLAGDPESVWKGGTQDADGGETELHRHPRPSLGRIQIITPGEKL
jgi:hypothetical protein